jgi:hypothetical protein
MARKRQPVLNPDSSWETCTRCNGVGTVAQFASADRMKCDEAHGGCGGSGQMPSTTNEGSFKPKPKPKPKPLFDEALLEPPVRKG